MPSLPHRGAFSRIAPQWGRSKRPVPGVQIGFPRHNTGQESKDPAVFLTGEQAAFQPDQEAKPLYSIGYRAVLFAN